MNVVIKDLLLGPPGLIFFGVLISGIGAFWATFQQAGFERELRVRSDMIAELSQNALYSVTGGDSFCYFQIMDLQPGIGQLVAVHEGNHPIYDVDARVVDLDKRKLAKTEIEKMNELIGNNIHIGNLTPGFARSVGSWIETNQDQLRLNIFFVARNGSYTQEYRRVRVKNGWAIATRVEYNKKYVIEEVSDSYPRDSNGTVNWN